MKTNKKAFTLIELMVVMAIIAVLAVLIIGAITLARRTATETTNRSNAKTIQTALEAYYAGHKAYPNTAPTDAPTWATFLTTLNNPSLTSSCSGTATIDKAVTPTYYAYNGVMVVGLTSLSYALAPANHDCTDANSSDKLSIN